MNRSAGLTRYNLESEWRLDAPAERVWEYLCHPEHWASWWDYVERVEEIEPGDENGIGAERRYVWKTRLPYGLTVNMKVTRAMPRRLLDVVVSGDLVGSGRCEIVSDGLGCRVHYRWNVQTRKAWMNWLSPILKPLFEWNHCVVMENGRRGLARELERRN